MWSPQIANQLGIVLWVSCHGRDIIYVRFGWRIRIHWTKPNELDGETSYLNHRDGTQSHEEQSLSLKNYNILSIRVNTRLIQTCPCLPSRNRYHITEFLAWCSSTNSTTFLAYASVSNTFPTHHPTWPSSHHTHYAHPLHSPRSQWPSSNVLGISRSVED